MSIAFIFGVLFFVSIYFYDKLKHEKTVEISNLEKQVQKQKTDNIEAERTKYNHQVENFKNSVSKDLSDFVWDDTTRKAYPKFIDCIPTGYDYIEVATNGRFDDGKAVIQILLIEDSPNLNIHYSVSSFEKYKQTGHSHEVIKLKSIIEMGDIYLRFLKVATRNNRNANLLYNPFTNNPLV